MYNAETIYQFSKLKVGLDKTLVPHQLARLVSILSRAELTSHFQLDLLTSQLISSNELAFVSKIKLSVVLDNK